jgi:hypothetical protein
LTFFILTLTVVLCCFAEFSPKCYPCVTHGTGFLTNGFLVRRALQQVRCYPNEGKDADNPYHKNEC